MMLGMPASSSIAMPIGRRSHSGHSSVRKSAISKPDRHRDQHGDERGDERAVDRRERAEFLGDRIPALVDTGKSKPKVCSAGSEPLTSDDDDAAENDQHDDRGAAREVAEHGIAEAQAVEDVRAERAVSGAAVPLDNARSTTGRLPGSCMSRSPDRTTVGPIG